MLLLGTGPLKNPSETLTLTFDFTAQGATLSPVVTASSALGVTDPSPSAILSGSPSMSGNILSQKVTGGVSGTTYELLASAADVSGNVYVQQLYLPVISL